MCVTCRALVIIINLFNTVDHEWKNSFFIKCLSPILEVVAAVSPLDYKNILELDARARDFQEPQALIDGATTRFLVMQRALMSSGRDIGAFPLVD